MTTGDFKEGMNVRYVPTHAEGDINHEDCENGIVHRVTSNYVFVRYFRHGMLQHTPEATSANDLRITDRTIKTTTE